MSLLSISRNKRGTDSKDKGRKSILQERSKSVCSHRWKSYIIQHNMKQKVRQGWNRYRKHYATFLGIMSYPINRPILQSQSPLMHTILHPIAELFTSWVWIQRDGSNTISTTSWNQNVRQGWNRYRKRMQRYQINRPKLQSQSPSMRTILHPIAGLFTSCFWSQRDGSHTISTTSWDQNVRQRWNRYRKHYAAFRGMQSFPINRNRYRKTKIAVTIFVNAYNSTLSNSYFYNSQHVTLVRENHSRNSGRFSRVCTWAQCCGFSH